MKPFTSKNPLFPFSIPHVLFILVVASASVGQPVQALESFPQDENHRGIIEVSDYQIYPEGRLGNAVYELNKLMFSFPDRVILDIMNIPASTSVVYLYEDTENNKALGLFDKSSDHPAKIKRVDEEFYEVWTPSRNMRKIFRIFQDQLVGVFFQVKSARGVTPARDHIAFYHITDVKTPENDGTETQVFVFKVHLLKRNASKVRTLPVQVENTSPTLKLTWVEETTLRYTLENGTSNDIRIKDYLPGF